MKSSFREMWFFSKEEEAYLTHVIYAVIHIHGTIFPLEAERTLASVVGKVVDAFGSVFAGIEFLGAEGDLFLAVLA